MSFLHALVEWAANNRYVLLLIGMFVEGPASTIAGGVAAAFGVMNLPAVLVLAAIGNLIPDFFFYVLGFLGREKILLKYGRYVGIRKSALERAEKIISHNAAKALVLVKLVPVLGSAGIAAAGSARIKPSIFFPWVISSGVALSSILVLLGYYFGDSYHTLKLFMNLFDFVIFASVATILFLLYIHNEFAQKLVDRWGKGK